MASKSEIIIFLAILVAIGFIAQRYVRVLSMRFGLKGESLIGIEFILIGMLIGPHGLHLITHDAFAGLFPIFALGLGWIGLTAMIEMDFRTVTRLPVHLAGMSLAACGITFVVVYLAFTVIMGLVPGYVSKLNWPLIMGLLALPVAPEMIVSQIRRARNRNPALKDVRILGILDDFHSLILYALLFPYVIYSYTGLNYFRILALDLAVGAVCALLLNLLTLTSRKRAELLLILLGMVFLTSGLSGMLQVSPLVAAGACGILVANSSIKRLRMAEVLQRAERPIFFFFLMLVGALLDIDALIEDRTLGILAGIAVLVVIVRLAGRYSGYWSVTRLRGPQEAARELTFIGQSGIYLALLVDLRLALHEPDGNELLFAGVLAFVLNSLLLHIVYRSQLTSEL